MTRRTLLQWLAMTAGTLRLPSLQAWAQTVAFPGPHGETLRQLASIVLPSSAGEIAARFERWVREYRPGAEMDHGYGITRIRSKGPSPAVVYMEQLAALPKPLSAKAIETVLVDAKIETLPRSPDGKNVIADLMSFYFNSSDAFDLCYRAAIGRDRCRGLDGSDAPPPPLKGNA
ncbi:MAG TPA: hypothetical protein VKU01_05205 [Bryobacteraceae bacterium]|nr:hypothetical protein [Bryobacteraceae bacterium]